MLRKPGGGGTPLYKLYRYVPPNQVGFLHHFGLKQVYTKPILVWDCLWFLRELLKCINLFIVSIPNE